MKFDLWKEEFCHDDAGAAGDQDGSDDQEVGDVFWGYVLGEFVGDGFEKFVCFGIYPCGKGGVVREHDMYDGKTYQKRADSCEEDKGK